MHVALKSASQVVGEKSATEQGYGDSTLFLGGFLEVRGTQCRIHILQAKRCRPSSRPKAASLRKASRTDGAPHRLEKGIGTVRLRRCMRIYTYAIDARFASASGIQHCSVRWQRTKQLVSRREPEVGECINQSDSSLACGLMRWCRTSSTAGKRFRAALYKNTPVMTMKTPRTLAMVISLPAVVERCDCGRRTRECTEVGDGERDEERSFKGVGDRDRDRCEAGDDKVGANRLSVVAA